MIIENFVPLVSTITRHREPEGKPSAKERSDLNINTINNYNFEIASPLESFGHANTLILLEVRNDAVFLV
jgi:hypothetical protein